MIHSCYIWVTIICAWLDQFDLNISIFMLMYYIMTIFCYIWELHFGIVHLWFSRVHNLIIFHIYTLFTCGYNDIFISLYSTNVIQYSVVVQWCFSRSDTSSNFIFITSFIFCRMDAASVAKDDDDSKQMSEWVKDTRSQKKMNQELMDACEKLVCS